MKMKKRIVLPLLLAMLMLLASCGSVPGMGGDKGDDGKHYIGDKVSTAFFDFSVTSGESMSEYEGYTAAEGNKLVVVNLNIKNTETYSLPMGQYDFMISWGNGDEDFAFPVEQYCDKQFADEYEIGIAKSVDGALVFEVPSDKKDMAIAFEEYYEDESVGDIYVIYFTVE